MHARGANTNLLINADDMANFQPFDPTVVQVDSKEERLDISILLIDRHHDKIRKELLHDSLRAPPHNNMPPPVPFVPPGEKARERDRLAELLGATTQTTSSKANTNAAIPSQSRPPFSELDTSKCSPPVAHIIQALAHLEAFEEHARAEKSDLIYRIQTNESLRRPEPYAPAPHAQMQRRTTEPYIPDSGRRIAPATGARTARRSSLSYINPARMHLIETVDQTGDDHRPTNIVSPRDDAGRRQGQGNSVDASRDPRKRRP